MKQNSFQRNHASVRMIVVLSLLLAFIFSTAVAYGEAEEEFAPIEKTFTRRSTRDPFMPVVGKKTDEAQEKIPVKMTKDQKITIPEKHITPGKIETGKVRTGAEKKGVQLVDVSDQLRVVGILRSGGVNNAIVQHNGMSYTVKPGQKLGEWTVASIDNRNVVLKAKNYKAVLKLETDMAAPGSGTVPAPK